MKIKLICDSTAGLTQDYIEENDIEIVHLNVIIDGVAYKDDLDITLDEVMEKFYNNSKVTTSQPSPSEYVNAFIKAKDAGYTDILCFTISSTLSGTFNSAKLASEEISGINIHIIDTLSASIGSELIIREAIDYLKVKSLEETLEYVERLKANAVILLNMENLTALKKSGRITRIKAAIGNLIRVKPILEYIGGKLTVISKFRTENAVFNYIIERLDKVVELAKGKVHVYLSHVKSLEKISRLKEIIEAKFKEIKVRMCREISPVVAVNIGYGGYGIAWAYE